MNNKKIFQQPLSPKLSLEGSTCPSHDTFDNISNKEKQYSDSLEQNSLTLKVTITNK